MRLSIPTLLLSLSLSLPALAADEGAALYKKHCATCHGADGKGQTTMGKRLKVKDWTDGKTLKALDDAAVKTLIHDGKKDDKGKQTMPAYASKLTDAQIDAVVQVVRTYQK